MYLLNKTVLTNWPPAVKYEEKKKHGAVNWWRKYNRNQQCCQCVGEQNAQFNIHKVCHKKCVQNMEMIKKNNKNN